MKIILKITKIILKFANMINLHLLITASLFIFGFNYAVDCDIIQKYEGYGSELKSCPVHKNILWFIKFYGDKILPEYWTRPIYSCVVCMSSLWGSILYFTFTDHYNIIQWLVSVVALAGLNRLLKSYL